MTITEETTPNQNNVNDNTENKTLFIKRPRLNPPLTKEFLSHEVLPKCFYFEQTEQNKNTPKQNEQLKNQAHDLLLGLKENIYKKTHETCFFLPQFDTNFNNVDLVTQLKKKLFKSDEIVEFLGKIRDVHLQFDTLRDEIIKMNREELNPIYNEIIHLNEINRNSPINTDRKANKKRIKYLKKKFKLQESICNELISIVNEIGSLDESIRECLEYKEMLEKRTSNQ
ncbi:hypothetical protein CDIK_0130 [Cucumispora dikerogammari]|nr:hypothetical protein CDIK_0130 [Cucumispora dikerogammari]